MHRGHSGGIDSLAAMGESTLRVGSPLIGDGLSEGVSKRLQVGTWGVGPAPDNASAHGNARSFSDLVMDGPGWVWRVRLRAGTSAPD